MGKDYYFFTEKNNKKSDGNIISLFRKEEKDLFVSELYKNGFPIENLLSDSKNNSSYTVANFKIGRDSIDLFFKENIKKVVLTVEKTISDNSLYKKIIELGNANEACIFAIASFKKLSNYLIFKNANTKPNFPIYCLVGNLVETIDI